jgi:hypothetical protein
VIPEGFENVSSEKRKELEERGTAAIENTTGEKIDNQSKDIFVFESGELDYFESNYQPFDEAIDGPYLESVKQVNGLLYETFVSQMPGVEIDSSTSVENIAGLEFQTLRMKIDYPNKMTMRLEMYSRLFDNREFTVNIMYVDETKGHRMRDAWKNSKFEM